MTTSNVKPTSPVVKPAGPAVKPASPTVKKTSSSVWVFRGLVIVGAGPMLLAWFSPWWATDATGDLVLKNAVLIHPWGLEQNMGTYSQYITGADMPGWFAPFAWTYLGICLAVLLCAIVLKDKFFRFFGIKWTRNEIMVGLVGVSYVVTAAIMFVVARIRTADFGVTFLGQSKMAVGPERLTLDSSLQIGFWLAIAVGIYLIAVAYYEKWSVWKRVKIVKKKVVLQKPSVSPASQ